MSDTDTGDRPTTLVNRERLERAQLNYRLAQTWLVALSGYGDEVMARAIRQHRAAEVGLLVAYLDLGSKEDE